MGWQAFNELRERILSCQLRPGSVITGYELAKELGMSRTPVIEALKMLCGEGLVAAVPRVGYVVAQLTLEDVEEMFDLRLVLEVHAVELALARASDRELEEFGQTCFEAHTEFSRGVLDSRFSDKREAIRAAAEAHDDFHLRIARLSGNRRLVDLINGLLNGTRRIRIAALQHEPTLLSTGSLKEAPDPGSGRHALLAHAMVSREANAATDHMSEHVRDSGQGLLAALREGRLIQPAPLDFGS